MDSATLVRDAREVGWQLLEELKKAQFPMNAAFWRLLPDSESWRLFIVTPLAENQGPLKAYMTLQDLLQKIPEEIAGAFSVWDITLLSPSSSQAKEYRKRFGKTEWNRARIRRLDLSPEEAYVYFFD